MERGTGLKKHVKGRLEAQNRHRDSRILRWEMSIQPSGNGCLHKGDNSCNGQPMSRNGNTFPAQRHIYTGFCGCYDDGNSPLEHSNKHAYEHNSLRSDLRVHQRYPRTAYLPGGEWGDGGHPAERQHIASAKCRFSL